MTYEKSADNGHEGARSNQRYLAHTNGPNHFFMVLALMLVVFNIVFLIFSKDYSISLVKLCAVQLFALNISLVISSIFSPRGEVKLNIDKPAALYGVFFIMYYLLPYAVVFFTDSLTDDEIFRIGVLFFLGYIGWILGMKRGEGASKSSLKKISFSQKNAVSLVVICIFVVSLIAYRYVVRTAEGAFFNQARYFESGQDVSSSFYEVFAASLELPVIFLLAALASVPYKGIAKLSYRFLIGYSSCLTLVYILSSQTRPAITAMIFALVALQFCKKIKIKSKHLALLVMSAFLMSLIIQGVRVSSSSSFAQADNQFIYALENTFSNGFLGATTQQDSITEHTLSRANGGIETLQEVMNATDRGHSYLYGEGVLRMLPSIMPRFLWPDKSSVTSPSIVVRNLLGLPLYDSILTPITQLYAEGGWIAVLVGTFMYGWLLGKINTLALSSGQVFWWFALAFLWSQVAQIELEMIVSSINVLRSALALYLIYRIIAACIPSKRNVTALISQ